MLVVHWSPAKNTRDILHSGISKSKHGTFCFPLAGLPFVDKCWADAFRQWRGRTPYHGFVFRVVEDDLPAMFGDWLEGAEKKPLTSIAQIQAEWESTIMSRIGQRHLNHGLIPCPDYEKVGRELVAQSPQIYRDVLGDSAFLDNIFSNHQLVLSRSIAPKRILHILSGGNDFGRNIARRKKERAWKQSHLRDE